METSRKTHPPLPGLISPLSTVVLQTMDNLRGFLSFCWGGGRRDGASVSPGSPGTVLWQGVPFPLRPSPAGAGLTQHPSCQQHSGSVSDTSPQRIPAFLEALEAQSRWSMLWSCCDSRAVLTAGSGCASPLHAEPLLLKCPSLAIRGMILLWKVLFFSLKEKKVPTLCQSHGLTACVSSPLERGAVPLPGTTFPW